MRAHSRRGRAGARYRERSRDRSRRRDLGQAHRRSGGREDRCETSGVDAATLVGMAFDSLFKQLCAERLLSRPARRCSHPSRACRISLERCLRWNWRVSKPACASRTETTICSQARGRPLTAASVSTGRVSSIASFAGGRKRWRRGLWSGRNAIGATDTPRNSLYRPLRAP